MGDFQYTAKNSLGETVTGTLTADNRTSAIAILEERRLFPLKIADKSADIRESASHWKVKPKDVGIMYGQLADLLGSGVPLLKALDSLIRSGGNKNLNELLKEIRASVADGKSLTEAFKQFPEVFPPLQTAMVQAGERASFLQDVLQSMSDFLERLDELRSKVIGSLIYPMALTVIGGLVLVGALIFFVPKFESLLANTQMLLPTAIVFALSRALRSGWHLIAMTLFALTLLFWGAFKSETGKRVIERYRMKIPFIGNAMRMVAISRFCRILGTLLANGVPLIQSLAIAKDATGSAIMAEQIAKAIENVREGKSLSEPLRKGGIFPDQIMAMLATAEESNRLDKVLLNIADTVERRTNRQVDQAVRLIEPLVLCLIAAGIGFMAIGLLLPIFTMAGSLGK
jgi:general secretion pathway protein F/type IV pilus assembly protein PilC